GLGKGTEISIVLPALGEAPVEANDRAVAPTSSASCRVLVIEDNRDAAESLRTLLVLTGHEVEVAHSGVAGLARAQAFHPEIVLCDIGLPGGLDGYAVARTMRGDAGLSSLYLVALTGYGQESDKVLSHHAGFDAHFTKPIDFAELQRHLTAVIHERL